MWTALHLSEVAAALVPQDRRMDGSPGEPGGFFGHPKLRCASTMFKPVRARTLESCEVLKCIFFGDYPLVMTNIAMENCHL